MSSIGLHTLFWGLSGLLAICIALQIACATVKMEPKRLNALGLANLGYGAVLIALTVVGLIIASGHETAAPSHVGPLILAKSVVAGLLVLTSVPTARAYLKWRRLHRDVPGLMPRPWEVRRVRRWLFVRGALFLALPALGVLMMYSH